jgi:hypothetical protein
MNDLVILLVLAGIALVFRWLSNQSSSDSDDSSPDPPNEQPSPPNESDEEQIRRFLEALGAPPGTPPPPKIQRRPTLSGQVVTPKAPPPPRPAKRSWVQPLPPLVTIPKEQEEARPSITTAPRAAAVVDAPPAPPIIVAAGEPPTPKLRAATAAPPVVSTRRSSLGALLRTGAGARKAIILRELLGPPRSFEPFSGAGQL